MDFRIPQSSVEGLHEDDYFWALIEPVWPDASVESELKHIATATPGQRALYVVTLCIREVCNGGFEQFFFNSSGIYAREVRKALRLLAAEQHAAAFEKALEFFPGRQVPVDQELRQELLEAVSKSRRNTFFEPLNEAFYGEERIWPYFQKYVDTHPSEFFVDAPVRPTGKPRRRRGRTRGNT
jgi:hypothetical protein